MYQQHGYAPPPQRTAIPKVLGILMIIFGSIGVIGGLINLGGGIGQEELMRQVPEASKLRTITLFQGILAMAMGAFQLFAGVRAVGYKSNAPMLVRAYAIAALVVVVGNMILTFAVIAPILEKAPIMKALGGGFTTIVTVIAAMFSLAWIVVLLVLMGKPQVKTACSNG